MTSAPPIFEGPLAPWFERFAQQMDTTGGNHVSLFSHVRRFGRFLAKEHQETTVLSREIVVEWFDSFSNLEPTSQERYRWSIFQLLKYLRGHLPGTATPEQFEPVRGSRSFRPYIFSAEEIALLLEAARSSPPRPTNPLRPWTLELVLGLLYTAGLRIGEVVRFDVSDYDPLERTLRVMETKFDKSRLVPLSGSAATLVENYLARRRSLGLSCEPEDSLVWPLAWSEDSRRPFLASVQEALVSLLRKSGLKPASGRVGPRIHDFRHTFAHHRVLQWYREGVDVQSRLAHLVTYMGHRCLESTQDYLRTLTPALLCEAGGRFERWARTARRGGEGLS